MCGRLRHGFGHIYTYELRPQRTSRVQEKHVCPIVIWCFESQNIVRTSTKRLFDSTNVTVVSPLRNYFAVHKEIARVSKILVSVSLQSLLRVDLLASLLREQYSTTNTSSSPMSICYNFTEVQRMHSRPSFRLQPLQPVSSHSRGRIGGFTGCHFVVIGDAPRFFMNISHLFRGGCIESHSMTGRH